MAETLEVEPNATGFDSLEDMFFHPLPYDQRYKKVRERGRLSASKKRKPLS